MQKFTQQKFIGLANLLKYKGISVRLSVDKTKPNRVNYTSMAFKNKNHLISVSINGRITVEKDGRVIDNLRCYGKEVVSEIHNINECIKLEYM